MQRKRFYKSASVTAERGIALDGRSVKTPMKQPLILPTLALAEAVAAEWNAQGDVIAPETMFLTKLANTAIDRVGPNREAILTEITAYAGSDLVCYRADRPPELVSAQRQAWDPVVAWAAMALGASFAVTTGLVHAPQSQAALAAFRAHVSVCDAFRLTALHNIMTLTGSALLAAMIDARAVDEATAWSAAHVDEDYQIAQWGEDEEAAARRTSRQREFADCCRFTMLSRN